MANGFCGRILRVDLTTGQTWPEDVPAVVQARWLGGAGYGSSVLYNEVPPAVTWDHPDNRVILAAGPLAGSRLSGTGLLAAVTRGPMTGGAGSTQANGFFGAFVKTQGYDAVIVQGQAPELVYLLVHDGGKAELRSAEHLRGVDTWDLVGRLKAEVGFTAGSVFGIGPAGENRVRFAGLIGDEGHAAAHNGLGAVLGAKRLKAVVVVRGNRRVEPADPAGLREARKELSEFAKTRDFGVRLEAYGTGSSLVSHARAGSLPTRNLTTNVFPEWEKLTGQAVRESPLFTIKPNPCWACDLRFHCATVTVKEGPHAGVVGDEPEYEGLSGMGSAVGNADTAGAVVLSNVVDRLGLDVNESAWVVGFAIEALQEGVLSAADVDGLDLTWGNVEAIRTLLHRIARREGVGALLAEGVKVAAKKLGGRALEMAVYAEKGNSPRGHDHRAVWHEILDTCVSNTSTIEMTGGQVDYRLFGLPPRRNNFDAAETALYNAKINGFRQFQDSLGVCRFTIDEPTLMVKALNAMAGWSWTIDDAMGMGRRVVHQLRAFNFRCGITAESERPSRRYGSAQVDGPARGAHPAAVWPEMRAAYYQHMGWDPTNGKPLPETLRALGQDDLIPVFWG